MLTATAAVAQPAVSPNLPAATQVPATTAAAAAPQILSPDDVALYKEIMAAERDSQYAKAKTLFDRLMGAANDLGLLAEEYDPVGKRQLGNFPQAFSHVGLINSAHVLAGRRGAARRAERERDMPVG